MQQVFAQLVLDLPQEADHGFAGTTPLLVHIDHYTGKYQRKRQILKHCAAVRISARGGQQRFN